MKTSLAITALLLATQGYALVTFTTNSANFASADDAFHWTQFPTSSVQAIGTPGTTDNGLMVELTHETLVIGDQGYAQDFPNTTYDPMHLGMRLGDGRYRAGTWIHPGWASMGFTLTMDAFDQSDVLVGHFSQSGLHAETFIGVNSDVTLGRVFFQVGTANPHVTSDFHMGPLLLDSEPVPEPLSMLALIPALLVMKRRR